MREKMDFFIFLIEQYAKYKNKTADVILRQWDKLKITETIYDMYELYHVEAIENAYNDIDRMISDSNQ